MPDYPGAWIGRVESVSGADVVLRVPAQQLLDGWKYRNQWLKVGGASGSRRRPRSSPAPSSDLTPLDRPDSSDEPRVNRSPHDDLLDRAIRESIGGRFASSAGRRRVVGLDIVGVGTLSAQ